MNKKCVPEGSFVKCSFAEATNIKRLKVTHNNTDITECTGRN